MTANQINYWRSVEDRRHNLASERETNRSNVARESEDRRTHLANETETKRTNLAKERETNRSNLAREKETNRANTAQEFIGRLNATNSTRANELREGELRVKTGQMAIDEDRAKTERLKAYTQLGKFVTTDSNLPGWFVNPLMGVGIAVGDLISGNGHIVDDSYWPNFGQDNLADIYSPNFSGAGKQPAAGKDQAEPDPMAKPSFNIKN